jgi:hypothetical protein
MMIRTSTQLRTIVTIVAAATIRRINTAQICSGHNHQRPASTRHEDVDRRLQLQAPITAFSGGLFVRPDLSVIRENLLPREAVQPVIDMLTNHKLDVWIYSDKDWFVPSRHGPHVDREEWTVKFPPIVVRNFEGLLNRVAKIVGVSDDLQAVARCEKDVQHECGERVSAARSGTLLPGRNSSEGQQRRGSQYPLGNATCPNRKYRYHRRYAERCVHVQAQRGEHRHGECEFRRAT